MGRWGTRTYVNRYVTHIFGVSLGHSANCAYGWYILVQLYMHLFSRTFAFIFALQHTPFESVSFEVTYFFFRILKSFSTFFNFPKYRDNSQQKTKNLRKTATRKI